MAAGYERSLVFDWPKRTFTVLSSKAPMKYYQESSLKLRVSASSRRTMILLNSHRDGGKFGISFHTDCHDTNPGCKFSLTSC